MTNIESKRSKRASLKDLSLIEREDVLRAIRKYKPTPGSSSTRYDLLIEGDRRLPPKAIFALAAERPLGHTLDPSEFSSGTSHKAFQMLWEHGFEIASKKKQVRGIKADFSVVQAHKDRFLVIESGNGLGRNPGYPDAFRSIMGSLRDLDAVILSGCVDSRNARRDSTLDPSLYPKGYKFPIRLGSEVDPKHLCNSFMRAAERAATTRRTGGNSTKKLRFKIDVPGYSRSDFIDIAEALTNPDPDSDGIEFGQLEVKDYQPGKGKGRRRKRGETKGSWAGFRRSAKSNKIGRRGEEHVFEWEKERVKEYGIDPKKKVRWLARDGETPGYDILSYNRDGTDRQIEVKSSVAVHIGSVILTENERKAAVAASEGTYWLYLVARVYEKKPTLVMISDPAKELFEVGSNPEPESWTLRL